MRLALAPEAIGLGELVRSVEPDFYLVECLSLDNSCTLTGRCRLTGIVNEALGAFLEQLDRHTLLDLLPRARTSSSAAPRTSPIRLPTARSPKHPSAVKK